MIAQWLINITDDLALVGNDPLTISILPAIYETFLGNVIPVANPQLSASESLSNWFPGLKAPVLVSETDLGFDLHLKVH